MSKTKKVVLIFTGLALVCIIGAGVVVGVFFAGGSDFSSFFNIFGRSKVDVDESVPLALDDVSALSIQCVTGRVVVKPADEARVELRGMVVSSSPKEKYLSVTQQDQTLMAKFDIQSRFPEFTHSDITMTVYLPDETALHLKVASTSGSISITDMRLGDLTINNVSGTVNASGIAGSAMDIHTVSGKTQVSGADFESIKVNSTSGSVDITDTPAGITVNETSGRVDIKGASGAVDISSISGGAAVDIEGSLNNPVSIGTVSGSIQLSLEADAAFDLDAGTTSGGIHSDFEVLIGGNVSPVGKGLQGACNGGGVPVNLSTVSGSITVRKK